MAKKKLTPKQILKLGVTVTVVADGENSPVTELSVLSDWLTKKEVEGRRYEYISQRLHDKLWPKLPRRPW